LKKKPLQRTLWPELGCCAMNTGRRQLETVKLERMIILKWILGYSDLNVQIE
jgi:hypothetical protein